MRDISLLLGSPLHPHVQLMADLGAAMANERMPAEEGMPTPSQKVDRCVLALKQACGEEILANAAGVVAMFAAMTTVVDATGQKSKEMASLGPKVKKLLRWKKNALACFPCMG